MDLAIVSSAGFEIAVKAARNANHAWVANVEVRRDGELIFDTCPATVQPEWLTSDEAVRDGIEWARRLIHRRFEAHESQSWVGARLHATDWYREKEERYVGQVVVG